MNPLELRKIVQIGYRFEQPVGAAPVILGGDGRNLEPAQQRYWGTYAFWLPAPKPFQRCAGETKVVGAFKHELEALRDGAIVEHVQEFEFESEPTIPEMARRLLPVWEALATENLGVPISNVPIDTTTRPTIVLTDVTPAKVVATQSQRNT